MDFPWYKLKDKTECLTQGDIILSCPIPQVIYDGDEYPYFLSGYIEEDVIIMTQACDMENRKVKYVTLCKIGSLEEHMKEYFYDQHKKQNKDEDFDFDNIRSKTKQNHADKIRRGNILDLYLLNKYNDGTLNYPYRVVYLRDSYRIPLETLEKIVQTNESPILRLLPPYREHLSHNFSFNFSRIGLPIDVKFPSDAF